MAMRLRMLNSEAGNSKVNCLCKQLAQEHIQVAHSPPAAVPDQQCMLAIPRSLMQYIDFREAPELQLHISQLISALMILSLQGLHYSCQTGTQARCL